MTDNETKLLETKCITISELIEKFGFDDELVPYVASPDTITIKQGGVNYIVNVDIYDQFIIIVLDSDENGNLVVQGDGKVTAVRRGHGWGDSIRLGNGHGNAIRSGKGDGWAYRGGKGYGRAMRMDSGKGQGINTAEGARAIYNNHLDDETLKRHEKEMLGTHQEENETTSSDEEIVDHKGKDQYGNKWIDG